LFSQYANEITVRNGKNIGIVYCSPSTQKVVPAIASKAPIPNNVGKG